MTTIIQNKNAIESAYNLKIIEQTIQFVKETLSHDTTGHDWWHIQRVRQAAIYIAEQEGGNLLIVELAALLHDIADWKFHDGDDKASLRVARKWLTSINLDERLINQVIDIIDGVTFKGANVQNKLTALEGKIVQDADRLDALGAIGIARAFTYGGYKGKPMHDPDCQPTLHNSFEEYKKHQGTTINHFYEKLLLLKSLMNTNTAIKIAERRHQFMQTYLQEFLQEWNSEDFR